MSELDRPTDGAPAGEPGSIIPGGPGPGMMPPAPDPVDDAPLGSREGRDPSNLGDQVRDEGDLVYPNPDPPASNI